MLTNIRDIEGSVKELTQAVDGLSSEIEELDSEIIRKENLLGGENEGWQVVQAFLSYERATIAPVSVVQSMIERLMKYIKATPERQ